MRWQQKNEILIKKNRTSGKEDEYTGSTGIFIEKNQRED